MAKEFCGYDPSLMAEWHHLMDDIPGVRNNYGYFPIFVDAEKYGMTRDELYFKMKENGVLGVSLFLSFDKRFLTL